MTRSAFGAKRGVTLSGAGSGPCAHSKGGSSPTSAQEETTAGNAAAKAARGGAEGRRRAGGPSAGFGATPVGAVASSVGGGETPRRAFTSATTKGRGAALRG